VLTNAARKGARQEFELPFGISGSWHIAKLITDRNHFFVSPTVGGIMSERIAADPVKLLEYWMEWEQGKTPPGRVISNLKTGGMREILEALVKAQTASG